MTSMRIWLMKKWFVLSAILVVGAVACGGGGGGGGGNNNGGVPTARPTITRVPTRTFTLGPGTPSVTATPTDVPPSPTPSLTPLVIGADLADAVRRAEPGTTILVPPGAYPPLTLKAEDVRGPIILVADRSDLAVSGTGALARVEARGAATAISLTGVADLIIDGFTITGGSLAGIRVVDGTGITIRNSVVRNNTRDGIRFERTFSSLLLNNLLYANSLAGISVVGTTDLRVINNTIYGSGGSGLIVGDSLLPSSTIVLRNNIFAANGVRGISVDPTTSGYDGNYNLNRDGYSRAVLRGPNDIINGDPLFNNPGNEGGFHLPPTDDDCNGGSAATDAGDPNTDATLVEGLTRRTTQTDERFDCVGSGCCPLGCPIVVSPEEVIQCQRPGLLDMGFHYVSQKALVTPTSTRRPTRSPTPPRPAPTATATTPPGV